LEIGGGEKKSRRGKNSLKGFDWGSEEPNERMKKTGWMGPSGCAPGQFLTPKTGAMQPSHKEGDIKRRKKI